ncbi:MAG TPA: cytochrome P450 [Ktedonobacterales bacterium]|nr:cytochrome P450 [Ktedonobacterales bacterium]
MSTRPETPNAGKAKNQTLSLYHLLDPEVLANPYPLFRQLREEDPVHWDPFLHAWVVTRYTDVITVFQRFLANRTPTPEQLETMGLGALRPLAQLMVRQMLFLDPPMHGRVRGLASKAFTPRRVEVLRGHIQEITMRLLDAVQQQAHMDVIADLGRPLPAIVTAELLGLPTSDWQQLTAWSTDFAQVLGNFQHNPDRIPQILRTVDEMTTYFHTAVQKARTEPGEGLISAMVEAEQDGDRLSDEEIVANVIITMVGGQETTTNLIGNGILTLLRHPDQLERLAADYILVPSAVEELLRYESPSQHTARLAPEDVELGGKQIRKRDAVIAVMAAANRDPERFPDPDRLDLARQDNRHLAFAWASHFCFGAPLARIEGQVAFEAMLRRMPNLRLAPEPLAWRDNLGLRGLKALPVTF